MTAGNICLAGVSAPSQTTLVVGQDDRTLYGDCRNSLSGWTRYRVGARIDSIWGGSSVGRALRSQCRGREFESPSLHWVFRQAKLFGWLYGGGMYYVPAKDG